MPEPPVVPAVGEQLGPLTVTIGDAQVRAYANASGDHNPIHLDSAFAATTPYGGPIAHGMLVLAHLSRLLTARFGAAWVATGSLDARFRAPAMVGSTISVLGEVSAVVATFEDMQIECAVRVLDSGGQALVTGTAKLRHAAVDLDGGP